MDNLLRSLKSRLQNSAALLSQSLDANALDVIAGPEDVFNEVYLDSLDKMRRVRRANPDIAYLYIMRLEGERVVFVVDSDETDAQAKPGQEYVDVLPELLAGFYMPSVDEELYEDEWGIFLSGYAPVRNGEGRYLVGIDMRADEVSNKLAELRLTGLVSLLASILLALLFALWLSRGLSRRISVLSSHCQDLAAGRLDRRVEGRTFDEFDTLADAFNRLSEGLAATRAEREALIEQLTEARNNLEERVADRTRELEMTMARMNVMSGLLPICSGCKKIRDDQGYWRQVEQFVSQHSGAKFSHGLCPDCEVSLYSEIVSESKQV